MKGKKGQVTLQGAPAVVMIVGLLFLIMATIAFIGEDFGNALATETSTTASNETVSAVVETGVDFATAGYRNVVCSTPTLVINASGGESIAAGNYTVTGCSIATNAGSSYNNTDWKVTYAYTYDLETVATNVTNDMNTEISNNTGIAGIVLTISLIGIVLSVLIGVFVLARNKGL